MIWASMLALLTLKAMSMGFGRCMDSLSSCSRTNSLSSFRQNLMKLDICVYQSSVNIPPYLLKILIHLLKVCNNGSLLPPMVSETLKTTSKAAVSGHQLTVSLIKVVNHQEDCPVHTTTISVHWQAGRPPDHSPLDLKMRYK